MNRRESLKLLLAASGTVLIPASAFGLTSHDEAAAAKEASGPYAMSSAVTPVFSWLTVGEVKPSGWIQAQMVRDLQEGFVGHLDDLCHEASSFNGSKK